MPREDIHTVDDLVNEINRNQTSFVLQTGLTKVPRRPDPHVALVNTVARNAIHNQSQNINPDRTTRLDYELLEQPGRINGILEAMRNVRTRGRFR